MEITVIKKTLIEKLKENLEIHERENKESMIGWRKEIIEVVDSLYEHTKSPGFTCESFHKTKIKLDSLLYDQPVDHSDDYKTALGMLEIHHSDTAILSEKQYKQYWLDDWGWKEAWAMSNTRYK